MTDHTGAPEVAGRVPRLTVREMSLIRECEKYAISEDQRSYYRLGGYGHAPIQYHPKSLTRLQEKDLVTYFMGRWKTTDTGRAALAALAAMEKQDG